jgi:cytochrome c biogenesis protein ResB
VRNAARQENTLDFSLLCRDIRTISYGESAKFKKHESTLSIIKNGVTIATQEVDFATPLRYEGIDIYQDRFSKTIPYAKIKIIHPDNQQSTHELKLGDSFVLGPAGVRIRATRLRADGVQLKAVDTPETLLVTQSPVQFRQPPLQGYQLSLVEFAQKEATTLKAIYDPGKGLIWYSFIFMVAGFSICFFCSHQRIWARIERTESGCSVTLAGAATKNVREISELIMTIRNRMQGE